MNVCKRAIMRIYWATCYRRFILHDNHPNVINLMDECEGALGTEVADNIRKNFTEDPGDRVTSTMHWPLSKIPRFNDRGDCTYAVDQLRPTQPYKRRRGVVTPKQALSTQAPRRRLKKPKR